MKHQLFFKQQIQEKWHQIIAMVPLDIYPPPRMPSSEAIFQPFAQEIQYFLIEDELTQNQQKYINQILQNSFKQHQEQIKNSIAIVFCLNQEQAIIKTQSYQINSLKRTKIDDWRKFIQECNIQLLEEIIKFSVQYQQTLFKFNCLFVNQDSIILDLSIQKHTFNFKIDRYSYVSSFNRYLDMLYISILENILNNQNSNFQTSKTINKLNQISLTQYFQNLPWTMKVKSVYLCKQKLNLTFYQGKIYKSKPKLYISAISSLIQQGLRQQNTELVSNLLIEIIKQSDQDAISKIFMKLYQKISIDIRN